MQPARALFECKKERIIGRTPMAFAPEKQADGTDSKTMYSRKLRAASSGEAQVFVWLHLRSDGVAFEGEVRLTRIDLGGESFVQAMVQDVTEKMHAKEALETSEKRYRMLLESANDAIFIADGSSGDLLDANQKAQAMVGRNLAEIQSMHLVGLHPKEFHETYKALF